MFEISEGVPSAKDSKKLQVKPEFPTLSAQLDIGPAVAKEAPPKTAIQRSRNERVRTKYPPRTADVQVLKYQYYRTIATKSYSNVLCDLKAMKARLNLGGKIA